MARILYPSLFSCQKIDTHSGEREKKSCFFTIACIRNLEEKYFSGVLFVFLDPGFLCLLVNWTGLTGCFDVSIEFEEFLFGC